MRGARAHYRILAARKKRGDLVPEKTVREAKMMAAMRLEIDG
ncbi:MAG: hypothetical protein QG664_702, partial [Patescibacteria group bacterium]|nr:hypothetical protein [Patescibacteria group bacterium]